MKNSIELDKSLEKEVILWSTENVMIDKKTTISVPMNYKTIALIDEKVAFRVEPCFKTSTRHDLKLIFN